MKSTNTHISGGLSLSIVDEWIDGIMDDLHDHEDNGWPQLGQMPRILEDLNFFARFNPSPLSTFG